MEWGGHDFMSAEALHALVRVGSTPSAPGPIEKADPANVLATTAALAIVVTSFFLALKYAGKAAR